MISSWSCRIRKVSSQASQRQERDLKNKTYHGTPTYLLFLLNSGWTRGSPVCRCNCRHLIVLWLWPSCWHLGRHQATLRGLPPYGTRSPSYFRATSGMAPRQPARPHRLPILQSHHPRMHRQLRPYSQRVCQHLLAPNPRLLRTLTSASSLVRHIFQPPAQRRHIAAAITAHIPDVRDPS